MTDIPLSQFGFTRIGVIVIGRNEGDRLRTALTSVLRYDSVAILYVDSGSTDGSIESAKSLGVTIHELDSRQPFSAARARREGVEILLRNQPTIDLIQFVDGDCVVADGWLQAAVAELDGNPNLGVVCGRLAEVAPEASKYNRMSELEWRLPPGDVSSCGGIFMIRRSVYEEVGGFNAVLVTREEKDLCKRIRAAGHRIARLDVLMAWHDAGMLHFSQWWSRAVWGGYGDAVEIGEARDRLNSDDWRRIGRYVTWPLIVPGVMLAGAIASWWWTWCLLVPLLGVAAYLMQIAAKTMWRLGVGDSWRDATTYACLRWLRRFGSSYGFMRYFIQRDKRRCRPDPHVPSPSSIASTYCENKSNPLLRTGAD